MSSLNLKEINDEINKSSLESKWQAKPHGDLRQMEIDFYVMVT